MNFKNLFSKRKLVYIFLFSIIFSFQFIIGNNLQVNGYSSLNFISLLKNCISILFLSFLFTILVCSIIYIYSKIKVHFKSKKTFILKPFNNWLFITFLIILCWIPGILAFFPGIINYDGGAQIQSALFLNNISTHHPIIHTLLLSSNYLLGLKVFNSCTIGMFFYTIFQVLFMASIFAYTIKLLHIKFNNNILTIFSFLFFAIFPVNMLLPLMTTKDVIFSGLVLLFIINLFKFIEDKYVITDYIFFILITVLMLLFRNNAIYSMLICIPFFIIFIKKKKRKPLIFTIVISLLVFITSSNLLIYTTKAEIGSNKEKLSVFSQGIARIVKYKHSELSEYELKSISTFFTDADSLSSSYVPYVSDRTKDLINIEQYENNKFDFYKLTFSLFFKYPLLAIDSFLDTTRGYWYIHDTSFSSISNAEYPNNKGYLEITQYIIGQDKYKVNSNSFLPSLYNLSISLFCNNNYLKIPILYLIFQPAFYFYFYVLCILYILYKKKYIYLLPGIFIFMYFITCFLGPCAIVRYIYPAIVCMPIFIGYIFNNKFMQ